MGNQGLIGGAISGLVGLTVIKEVYSSTKPVRKAVARRVKIKPVNTFKHYKISYLNKK